MAEETFDSSAAPDRVDAPARSPGGAPAGGGERGGFVSVPPGPLSPFHRDLLALRRRLIRAGNVAIDMLEASIWALWNNDKDLAADIRRRDDAVDDEEVAIERECLRLITLQQPYGQDFRALAFCLKVNADIERVADHATSLAKVTLQLEDEESPSWPVALVEIGDRIPEMCQNLMRSVLEEDVEGARSLITKDSVIDRLDKRLFTEIIDWIKRDADNAELGLLCYRVGRELERVGDLLGNIAEDVVYLATGKIIRHQHKGRPAPGSGPEPGAAGPGRIADSA